MELRGKTILFLGDSITEGHGTSSVSRTFWNVTAERTGARCLGFGIGGTRIARQQKPSDNPVWDRYFVPRVDEMPHEADAVVVFGGTNDFGHGDAPLGVMEDRTVDTFYGALHALCLKLIERYPQAQLVIMTPLHRDNEKGKPDFVGKAPLEEYVNAICQVAAYYGIPVLDLYRVSGMQPAVPVLKQLYMPDGLHPSDAGHVRIAEKLIGFMKTL